MRFMRKRTDVKMKLINKIIIKSLFSGPSRDPGENYAARALKKEGYKIIDRNYDIGFAEIDLIAEKGDFLVFVEVKQRKTTAFGLPCQAVGPEKRRKIRRAAEHYIIKNKCKKQPRFDVVEIYGVCGETAEGAVEKPKVRHIKNAF